MLRSPNRAARLLLAAVLLLPAAACASSSAGPDGPRRSSGRGALACDDFRAVSGASTAYGLVARLRPTWLQVRGPISFHNEPGIGLIVDGRRSETFAALQDIPARAVVRIERLQPDEAKIHGQFPQGAISVTTGNC